MTDTTDRHEALYREAFEVHLKELREEVCHAYNIPVDASPARFAILAMYILADKKPSTYKNDLHRLESDLLAERAIEFMESNAWLPLHEALAKAAKELKLGPRGRDAYKKRFSAACLRRGDLGERYESIKKGRESKQAN